MSFPVFSSLQHFWPEFSMRFKRSKKDNSCIFQVFFLSSSFFFFLGIIKCDIFSSIKRINSLVKGKKICSWKRLTSFALTLHNKRQWKLCFPLPRSKVSSLWRVLSMNLCSASIVWRVCRLCEWQHYLCIRFNSE